MWLISTKHKENMFLASKEILKDENVEHLHFVLSLYIPHTHTQINAQWSMDLAWDDHDLLGSQTMDGLSPDS